MAGFAAYPLIDIIDVLAGMIQIRDLSLRNKMLPQIFHDKEDHECQANQNQPSYGKLPHD